MKHQMVIVLNLGGSQALTVAKRVRECGVYSQVIPYTAEPEELAALAPRGIIVTGTCDNVHAAAAEKAPRLAEVGCPVLEVGMGTAVSVEALAGGIGKTCLDNFLKITCDCTGDWSMADFARQSAEELRQTIGDRRVLIGVTGLDTATTAALLAQAVGKQCTAVVIDSGLLRKNEVQNTMEALKGLDLNAVKVNAETKFMFKLLGIDDPVKKKAIITQEYAALLEREAARHEATCLALGTVYTDLLVNRALPLEWQPEITLEPLHNLFKDEVRQLAEILGLPEEIRRRQPLPLYGLATRCIGAITMERLDLLRDADAIYDEEIRKAKLDKNVNQFFAAITNFKSAAIRGNRQTYEYTLVLRAAATNDFISAQWSEIPTDLLRTISRRLTTELSGVSRVLFDVTSTPPSAIEFE